MSAGDADGPGDVPPALTVHDAPRAARWEVAALVLFVVAGAWWWNHGFAGWIGHPLYLQENDIPAILRGYHRTPDLWRDGLAWWHGPWIEDGIGAFRPLSSYLLWIETHIGLTYSFQPVGWIGFALFCVNCLLCAALAWRLTRSRGATLLAALLAVQIRVHSPVQPPFWLGWYPAHQDLLVSALMLATVVAFDVWYERGEARWLAAAFLTFVTGCLTKEYAYFLPAPLAAIVLFRHPGSRVRRRRGFLVVGLFAACVIGLWLYRRSVLPNPYNPSLKAEQLWEKPLLFLYGALARHLLTEHYWLPCLAVALCGLAVAWRCRHAWRWPQALHQRRLFWPAAALLLFLILEIGEGSAALALWTFIEWPPPPNVGDLIAISAGFLGTLLLWKYRRTESTLAAGALVVLWYLPVIDYNGWHYMIAGWFVRCCVNALAAKLLWLELAPGAAAALRRVRRLPSVVQPLASRIEATIRPA